MARGRLPERTDAPQSQAALAQRQRETVTPEDLLLTAKDASKKILFVGECTHLFTAAAAKLVTQKLPGLELNWTSTELCWPSGLEVELKRTVEWLRSCGVTVANGVDATRLPSYSPKALAAAIWVMPFPRGAKSRSTSSTVKDAIQGLIQGLCGASPHFWTWQRAVAR
ncbi:unnamed protein product [Effrenium voratum]|uniref:Uncharacterized protein n=1 Tax=Effrenium voratum TaxID=2562239 RepID=A0AA36JET1_9DINO|nr:unnamed protein product [Effrenium voratum]